MFKKEHFMHFQQVIVQKFIRRYELEKHARVTSENYVVAFYSY